MNAAKHGNQRKKKQIWLKLSDARIVFTGIKNIRKNAKIQIAYVSTMDGATQTGSAQMANGGDLIHEYLERNLFCTARAMLYLQTGLFPNLVAS